MSRENTSTDNSVIERLNRTLKECKINEVVLQDAIFNISKVNSKKAYPPTVSRYVKFLNEKPNKKPLGIPPKLKDREVDIAYNFMLDPLYPKAYSKHFGGDLIMETYHAIKDLGCADYFCFTLDILRTL
jgi:hypothetical protein